MPRLLEIHKASKAFHSPEGGTITALDEVSLSLSSAEFLTLLGPSGCGKTTLLRAISGFEPLDRGQITIDGQEMTDRPAHRRPVNTVFQRYALFPHLTVGRNVSYALEIAGTPKAEIRTRVGEMLDLVGLAGLGQRGISQLSGGQQQRVALARALVARPKLLLLDEPLSALDKNLRRQMQLELKRLQEELQIGFVFVTHDQEEALTMSDRIAVLAQGQIQQLGTPEDLYRHPANRFTAEFLGESNLLPVALHDGAAILADGQRVPASGRGTSTLMIRPEMLGTAPVADGLTFAGTIRERFYSGTSNLLIVETQAFGMLQALLRADAPIAVPGSPVTLYAGRADLHIIPGGAT